MPKNNKLKKTRLRLKHAMPELAWRLICIDKAAMESDGATRERIMLIVKEMFDIMKDMGFDCHGYEKTAYPYRRKL